MTILTIIIITIIIIIIVISVLSWPAPPPPPPIASPQALGPTKQLRLGSLSPTGVDDVQGGVQIGFRGLGQITQTLKTGKLWTHEIGG